jgi:hypothetical protein
MSHHRIHRFLLGAFALGALLLGPACDRAQESREVKEMSQKAAELDKMNQQAAQAGAEEKAKLAQAGINNVAPDPNTLQLSDEQKAALEARIKAEKNSSYQALLQEVLDKDKEIKDLNTRIGQLRAVLPKPEIAGVNDSHYGMAMRFLRKRGVGEEKARTLISKVLMLDKLAPGFEVYHFYANGVYGSWVTQGRASQSPTELQAEARTQLEGERDSANQKSAELEGRIAELNAQAEQLTGDIDALRTEKAKLTKDVDNLNTANEAQKSMLNSVHYVVGQRKELVQQGVIVVPVFARDRAGSRWDDEVFNKSADLRTADSITLNATDAGLEKIGKINVVPGSLEKDRHYAVEFNPERTVATVKFLDKERFRNEKVAFALTD